MFRRIWQLIDDFILYPLEFAVTSVVRGVIRVGRAVGTGLTVVFGNVAFLVVWPYDRVLAPIGRLIGKLTGPLANAMVWCGRRAAGPAAEFTGADGPLALLAALLCIGLSVAYFSRGVQDLSSVQAIELAQTARNLSQGQGLSTDAIRPLSLVFHEKIDKHPDFHSPPLQAFTTALAFVLHSPSDRMAAVGSAVFLLPTLWLIFIIGSRVGGTVVGAAAAVAYAVSLNVLREAFSGTGTQLAAFLFTLWVYLALVRDWDRSIDTADPGAARAWSGKRLLWSGAVFGLLILSDWHFALLWVVALVFVVLWSQAQSLVRAGLGFLLGTVLVLSPMLIRNAKLTRDPLFSLHNYYAVTNTARYPGTSLLRTVSPRSHSSIKLAVTNLKGVARKTGGQLLLQRNRFANWLDPYLFAVFLVALLMRSRLVNDWGLKAPLVAFMLLRAGVGCMFGPPTGGYLPFAPLGMVLAANALISHVTGVYVDESTDTVRKTRAWARIGLPTLVLVLAAIPLGAFLTVGQAPRNPNTNLEKLEAFPSDAVFVSDDPWSVAWYGKRKAIWAPQTTMDLAAIETQITPISGMVLTRAAQGLGREQVPDTIRWGRLFQDPTFYAGYMPQGRLEGGAMVYQNVRVPAAPPADAQPTAPAEGANDAAKAK